MEISLKIIRHQGLPWVAVGVGTAGDRVIVVGMRNDREAFQKAIPIKQWNRLPHHRFVDQGPTEKTKVKHKP